MENIDLILIGIGLVAFIISLVVLIINVVKGKYKISKGLIASLLTGLAFIIAGIVQLDSKETEKESVKSDEIISKNPLSNEGEDSEAVSNEASGAAIVNQDTIIYESDPLKIAEKLIDLEMSKLPGDEIKSWKIINNEITSDNKVFNMGDYDKPVGDMRKVWITGTINITIDDGSNGNFSYDLELYQMRGDSNWFVGQHWGILKDIKVTEKPNVVENSDYISDNDEMIIDDETGGLATKNKVPEYGEVDNVFIEQEFTKDDLIGAWHWKESDDFYMILRNDGRYSYIEKNAGFVSEGFYSVYPQKDEFKIGLDYTTGQDDSVMFLKMINNNSIKGNENGYTWEANRVNLEEAEKILKGLYSK